jgi:hypothetical protein
MATSAERLIILLERYHIDSGPAGASLDGQGAGVVNVYGKGHYRTQDNGADKAD